MLDSISICLTLRDLYLGVICLFPITTTLKDGSVLNKAMFALLLVLHVCMFLSRPIKKRTLFALLALAANYAVVLANTVFPLQNYNLLVYFPFFLMYTYFVCDHREELLRWFLEHEGFVFGVILCWCTLVGISALLPGCYQVREGGELYFGSFCKDIFRLGPSAVFVQVLIILSQTLYGKRKRIVFMAVPMYCYLMGSSRTYLVIGFFLLVISWYLACGGKRLFWGTVLPLTALVALLAMGSAMGNKIAYTLDEEQYGDFWYRITSSRSYLWAQYLRAWMDAPLWKRLLGNDLEFTLKTAGKWAHNDFIELACSFGIFGVLHYLYAVRLLLRRSWENARVPPVLRLCAVLVWLFNACFNMHYVYFCAMLSYPLLLLGLGWQFDAEKVPLTKQHRKEKNGYEKAPVHIQY